MNWLWTWGGKCFGYKQDDRLFTHHGIQAGQFHGDEIYGSNGVYLGEIQGDRLITNQNKKHLKRSGFSPSRVVGSVPFIGYVGNVMYVGYEDFPAPENFK